MNKYLNILLPTLILSGCFTMNYNTPPKPKKIPYKLEAHGDIRIDNYYWMRDDSRSDPELISYLESENEYFKKWRNDRINYQDEIFNELKNMIPAEEETLRVKDGNLIWNERRPHVSLQKRLNKKNIRWTLRTRQELRLRDDKDPITRNRFRIFANSNKIIGKFRPYLGNEFFFDFEKKSYNKNWLVFGFDLTESNQYAPTIYYKYISDLVNGKWTSTYTLIFKVTI